MDTPTQPPTYEIANYLPELARRHAAGLQYRGTITPRLSPRTAAGECPLGAALHAMGLPSKDAPAPYDAAMWLADGGRPFPAVFLAAITFVDAWEMGRILDLAAAFGVRP